MEGPFWVVVSVVVGGGVFVLLCVVPTAPYSVSGQVFAPGSCVYCPALPAGPVQESFPIGAWVHLTWSEPDGAPVGFVLWNASRQAICSGEASQGSCTFTSGGGPYTLFLRPPSPPTVSWYVVDFTASYTAPLL